MALDKLELVSSAYHNIIFYPEMYTVRAGNIKVIPKSVFAELPETYKLSKEQFQFYEDNGYLVIKQLVDFGSLYSYKRRFQQICSGIVPRGNMTVQKIKLLVKQGVKPEDYVEKVQDILYDDVFSGYAEYPALLDVVSQFIGDNISVVHSMLINKPPGTGRHPPHQDMYYFPIRPIEKVVGTWTAIDDVTIDNGCLFVVPGSHKNDIYEHDRTDGPIESARMYHGVVGETGEADAGRVDLEMSPGDTVFLHPLLMHGSRENRSKNYRKAISCHYASSDCHFIEVAGTVQQRIVDEILAEARRRGLHDATIEDIFRYRSKHVKGIKSNL